LNASEACAANANFLIEETDLSVHPAAASPENTKPTRPVTTVSLQDMHARNEKIAMLTCYDASFAALMDTNGVDVLLIGDSLGMVSQGRQSTLPVTLTDMAYHTACVARGASRAMVITDLSFGTYLTPEQTLQSAVTLMQNGAHMVKLEGGAWLAPSIRLLTERGIPVCAHLGLTPQSVHMLGGFRVQGKDQQDAAQLHADALAVQDAGASMLVLEAVPASLGKTVTAALAIPTIGIGAGPDCSGQVLVMHDMLGVFPGHRPRFVRDFMQGQASIGAAVAAYVSAVKNVSFPAAEHCF
jgi:3-methyl-2-oxobutanoate hydroxymethyltransferase